MLPRTDSLNIFTRRSADAESFFSLPEFVLRGQDSAESDKGKCAACDGKGGACCHRPGEITFKPGLRVQTRYNYNDASASNDIYIRRLRIKGSGKLFDVGKYGFELRTDNSSQFGGSSSPVPEVENAWVDFTIGDDLTYLRVGLNRVPFSRDALTSDSKLLLMDYSLARNALTNVGMADNGVGVFLHGRPREGRFEYAIGAFDSVRYEAYNNVVPVLDSNQLMPMGRVVWNLLDPSGSADGYVDYRASYLGEGRRLSVGANAGYLANASIAAAPVFDIEAYGVDLFWNSGPFVVQAEYDWFQQDFAGAPSVDGRAWFVQGGVLLRHCWEVTGRYQSLRDPINPIDGSTEIHWTSLGVNYYIHDHNLKVQADYTWKDELGTEIANDGFQVQLQLDF